MSIIDVKIYLQYFSYVLRHKWFVFIEACKLGIPWLGLIHDNSKFLPDEFIPYAHYFYGRVARRPKDGSGYFKPNNTGAPDFDYAWLIHQKRNKHHWQWWILTYDEENTICLEMPDRYRREMLADWIGAGKAQGRPNTRQWYRLHKSAIYLHPNTRAWVEKMLGVSDVGKD